NTCLIAFGTALSGFSDSPAVIPISSVPWNENPATKNTPNVNKNVFTFESPRNGASPTTKLSNPKYCPPIIPRSEEHTSELQSRFDLVCRLLLEKKNTIRQQEATVIIL